MRLKIFKRGLVFLILPIAALSIIAISYLRILDHYELSALDLRFIIRSKTLAVPVTDKVVIIAEVITPY